MKKFYLVLLSFYLVLFLEGSSYVIKQGWADTVLAQLTLEEKIGQLFMIAAYAESTDAAKETLSEHYLEEIDTLIKKYHVGGILFKFRWLPQQQLECVKHYQNQSKIPLLMAQDLEWGLSMRLDNTIRYPKNLALGAIQDDSLIYELGKEIGRQCHLVGIQVNFAPVVDINSNPKNPVIHERSFGACKENVARKGIALMRGLQDVGMIACAKHFPGHGDTAQDSHDELPLISKSKASLWQFELYPFRRLIQEGIKMVMVAHLSIPALDKDKPTSLSYACVTDLLKKKIGFKGIVITDDLIMNALQPFQEFGNLALHAFLAGNDILLSTRSTIESIEALKEAVKNGSIQEKDIDQRVLKILRLKEQLFSSYSYPKKEDLAYLHKPEAYALRKRLYQAAMTLVKDDKRLVPLRKEHAYGYIQFGAESTSNSFEKMLNEKLDLTSLLVSSRANAWEEQAVTEFVKDKQHLIVTVFEIDSKNKEAFGLSSSLRRLISSLQEVGKSVVLVLFGTPYSVELFSTVRTILLAYEPEIDAQKAAAQVLLGEISARGKLPVHLHISD